MNLALSNTRAVTRRLAMSFLVVLPRSSEASSEVLKWYIPITWIVVPLWIQIFWESCETMRFLADFLRGYQQFGAKTCLPLRPLWIFWRSLSRLKKFDWCLLTHPWSAIEMYMIVLDESRGLEIEVGVMLRNLDLWVVLLLVYCKAFECPCLGVQSSKWLGIFNHG